MDKIENQTTKNKDPKSKQGAAMMAVMLILLVATATAAITVESTGYEAKASGYNRIAAQVKNISEVGLISAVATTDRVGAESLKNAMKTNYEAKLAAFNQDRPADEPEMVEGGYVYQMNYDDYSAANKPIDDEAAIGPHQAYTVKFMVDIYDAYISNRSIPGYSVDGRPGAARFLQTTYIARGQMVFPTQDGNEKKIEHVSCACIEAGPF